jgi:hypothetical protein
MLESFCLIGGIPVMMGKYAIAGVLNLLAHD